MGNPVTVPSMSEFGERGGRVVGEDKVTKNEVDLLAAIQRSVMFAPTIAIDTSSGDSDKTLTVTALREWRVQSLRVSFVTSASTGSTGDRLLELQLHGTDTGNIVAQFVASAVQPMNVTRQYVFAPGLPNATGPGGMIFSAIPDELLLGAGFGVRVFDRNAVNSTGDNLVPRLLVAQRVVPST